MKTRRKKYFGRSKRIFLKSNYTVHPLALLACSRIPLPDGYISTPLPDVFLRAFATQYPKGADRFLTMEEKVLIQRWTASTSGENEGEESDGTDGSEKDPGQKWEDLKVREDVASEAMESLIGVTGLRRVKLDALRMFKQGLAFSRMDPEIRKLNVPTLNYSFLSNPGTGKTTVARLFAQILHDSGLRKKKTFVECSGQKLKEDGPDELRNKAKEADEGVLFIDEAYCLDPIGDKFKGAPVVNELVVLAENNRERTSFIIAGYEDDMNDKFFSYNLGLKSRFIEVQFDDFEEAELYEVWKTQITKRRLTEADDRTGKVVIRRLAKLN